MIAETVIAAMPDGFADEAIVLAGGRGTRLQSMVHDVPKPLAPVAGRPFLAWLLDRLADGGIRRVILATGYLADQIEATVGTRWRGMQVEYSVESSPLGTGGAVRLAAGRLRGRDAHVLNGDTFLRYDFAGLERTTRALGATIGIALARVDDLHRYGAVESRRGLVTAFHEKGRSGAGWINAGCYFLSGAALDALPDKDCFSLETEVLVPLAAQSGIAEFNETEGFIDIGVPEDYLRAQELFGGDP